MLAYRTDLFMKTFRQGTGIVFSLLDQDLRVAENNVLGGKCFT